ncbi:Uncharacterised protein [Mycobacteroides abscessus subsp. abscessus]|jgi:hypothetical protein|uniref:Uncharacterized protein n=1 Tax=Mycobacteroides abscessus subsp. abscessus TaxID=1185650 RepID=A0AB38D4F1_9MYCO|nr:hypothetical protein PROPHIGD102-2_36 [Mycobacterium phage prophi102-2]QSM04010.1 hypothetical protein PROPHIGD54-1_36 [Mycobacterium phage prophiGD54-1]CPS02268.1 Uncharacterised protein [Mycobacteroides abscessus]SHQ73789.1 Uncharacterised protein [Mycobacteroides abscessus subsp. abscessus]CPS22075.1 Uncharacterised protein [Mycobacteroides abscessus]
MSDYEEDTGRRDKPGPYDVNDALERDCAGCGAQAGLKCPHPNGTGFKSCPCVERLKAGD